MVSWCVEKLQCCYFSWGEIGCLSSPSLRSLPLPFPPSSWLFLSLLSVWLVYSPVSTSYKRPICWHQGRPVSKLFFSPVPFIASFCAFHHPLEVMSKRLLLSGINRCSPCRKTKSAIDNCKQYTAATVSIGVSSAPLLPGDKETHSLEQYHFFWPICLLQTYDE